MLAGQWTARALASGTRSSRSGAWKSGSATYHIGEYVVLEPGGGFNLVSYPVRSSTLRALRGGSLGFSRELCWATANRIAHQSCDSDGPGKKSHCCLLVVYVKRVMLAHKLMLTLRLFF